MLDNASAVALDGIEGEGNVGEPDFADGHCVQRLEIAPAGQIELCHAERGRAVFTALQLQFLRRQIIRSDRLQRECSIPPCLRLVGSWVLAKCDFRQHLGRRVARLYGVELFDVANLEAPRAAFLRSILRDPSAATAPQSKAKAFQAIIEKDRVGFAGRELEGFDRLRVEFHC
jgi:hypothetical protein